MDIFGFTHKSEGYDERYCEKYSGNIESFLVTGLGLC